MLNMDTNESYSASLRNCGSGASLNKRASKKGLEMGSRNWKEMVPKEVKQMIDLKNERSIKFFFGKARR